PTQALTKPSRTSPISSYLGAVMKISERTSYVLSSLFLCYFEPLPFEQLDCALRAHQMPSAHNNNGIFLSMCQFLNFWQPAPGPIAYQSFENYRRLLHSLVQELVQFC